VKFTDSGSVRLELSDEGDRFGFQVVDTGIGISAAAVKGIFEPFQQCATGKHRGGAGLGLAIARRLVALMGGELAVCSEAGSGSRFFFSLPLRRAADAEQTDDRDQVEFTESAPHFEKVLAADCRIRALVVDDVSENRQVLAEMLRQTGCNVIATSDDADFGDLVETKFDIAFIDIMMPAIDGATLAERLRATTAPRSPRLIATSAALFAGETGRGRDGVFDDFLPKPLRWNGLYACIEKVPGARFVHVLPEAGPTIEAAGGGGHNDLGPALGLSAQLRSRLIDAARMYRVTEFRRGLLELERIGPTGATAARYLRRCLHNYDMRAVTTYLERQAAVPDGPPESETQAAPLAGTVA